jgi:hypothetical protein
MIRSKISSEIQDLNDLHKIYFWIPNENMIRPNQKVLENKREFNNYVLHNWMSFKDFILDTHFHFPVDIEDGHLYVIDTTKKMEWHFTKSLFPYDLPENVNHYVLWNSFSDCFHVFDDSKINNIIKETLESMVGDDNFDFAWYINPKPSIPEIWHCQVFWIKT